MSDNHAPSRQRGFSLTEVLIAAVIAAGVVAAAAGSLSASVRLSRASGETSARVQEARTIIARVRAGMVDREALMGFDDWRIARTPVPPLHENDPIIFEAVVLSTNQGRKWAIEFWAPTLDASAIQLQP